VQTLPWRVGRLNARSLSNKTGAIHETIDNRRLDVFAVTADTWHRCSDDASLRLSAPPGYATVDAVRESDPSHGGIIVFHRRRFTCTKVDLPPLSTFEGLCVRLSVDGDSVTLLTIYRPGSTRVTSAFYDEMSTVLESLVLQSEPVMVGGDINIHVEDAADADTARLAAVFDAFDMQQHIIIPVCCYPASFVAGTKSIDWSSLKQSRTAAWSFAATITEHRRTVRDVRQCSM